MSPPSWRPDRRGLGPSSWSANAASAGTLRLVRLLQEAVDQAVGAAAIGESEVAGQVARRGGEIEALVLLVAAGERAAGEIPGQPEDADALLGWHSLGAGQVAVDQGPQVLVRHLRGGRRGEDIVRADQAHDLVHARKPDR